MVLVSCSTGKTEMQSRGNFNPKINSSYQMCKDKSWCLYWISNHTQCVQQVPSCGSNDQNHTSEITTSPNIFYKPCSFGGVTTLLSFHQRTKPGGTVSTCQDIADRDRVHPVHHLVNNFLSVIILESRYVT